MAQAKEKVERIKAQMAGSTGTWTAPKAFMSEVVARLDGILAMEQPGREQFNEILSEMRRYVCEEPGEDGSGKKEVDEAWSGELRSKLRQAKNRKCGDGEDITGGFHNARGCMEVDDGTEDGEDEDTAGLVKERKGANRDGAFRPNASGNAQQTSPWGGGNWRKSNRGQAKLTSPRKCLEAITS